MCAKGHPCCKRRTPPRPSCSEARPCKQQTGPPGVGSTGLPRAPSAGSGKGDPPMTPRGRLGSATAAEGRLAGSRRSPYRRDVVLARQPGLGPGPVPGPSGGQPGVPHRPALQLHQGHDHGGRRPSGSRIIWFSEKGH